MPQLPIPPPPKKEHHYAESLWCTYLISVAASWVAELGINFTTFIHLFCILIICFFLVTYPLDLTKTRLQIQGEIANKTEAKLTRVE